MFIDKILLTQQKSSQKLHLGQDVVGLTSQNVTGTDVMANWPFYTQTPVTMNDHVADFSATSDKESYTNALLIMQVCKHFQKLK